MCKHDRTNSWWIYDAQGIPVSRVCDQCEATVRKRYRPEIFTGYDQSDVDEPIDADEWQHDAEYSAQYAHACGYRD